MQSSLSTQNGKLTDLITRWVSVHPNGKELASRISLLDPTQKNNSVGYNPLEMPEDEDLQSAASAVVYGFKGHVHRASLMRKASGVRRQLTFCVAL